MTELLLVVMLGKEAVFVLLFAVDQFGTAQCMMMYLYEGVGFWKRQGKSCFCVVLSELSCITSASMFTFGITSTIFTPQSSLKSQYT